MADLKEQIENLRGDKAVVGTQTDLNMLEYEDAEVQCDEFMPTGQMMQ